MRPMSALTLVFSSLLTTGASVGNALGQDLPVADEAASKIMAQVDSFYRGLPTISCFAEVEVKLGEGMVEDRVGMRGIAVRPNRVSIMAIEPHGYFPTNQFVSNGKTLFEQSIRRRMFMLSAAGSDMQSLHDRAAMRSAPNMPVEVFLSLLSDRPIQNLLQLEVEPGLIRLVGQVEIEGGLCNELVVNENGSRVWTRVDSPHWVMRYRNSPTIAQPRYLPPGAKVTGPSIQVDFKNWSMAAPNNEGWDWVLPEGYIQMATMHESARGGPEEGYSSLILDENVGVPSRDATEVGVGLQIGPNKSAPTDDPKGPARSAPAPDVELVAVDGSRTTLTKLRDGRPAALVFWSKDRKFSRSGLPRTINGLRALGPSLAVIPIGSGSDARTVGEMVALNPAFAGSYTDAGKVVAERYDLVDISAVILIDHDGNVSHVYIGQNPRLELTTVARSRKMIEAHAAQQAESGVGGEDGSDVPSSEDPDQTKQD